MITVHSKKKLHYTYENGRLLYRNSDFEDYNKYLKMDSTSYTGLKWKSLENKLNKYGELTLKSKERIAGTLRNDTPNNTYILNFKRSFHNVSHILFTLKYGYVPSPIFKLNSYIEDGEIKFTFCNLSKKFIAPDYKYKNHHEFNFNDVILMTKKDFTLHDWYFIKNYLLNRLMSVATDEKVDVDDILTFILTYFRRPSINDLKKIIIMLENKLYPLY